MKKNTSFPQDKRATAAYWLKPEGDTIVLTGEEIRAVNRRLREQIRAINNLTAWPTEMSQADLQEMIGAAEQDFRENLPGEYYDTDGTPILPSAWEAAQGNCALGNIKAKNLAKYALTRRRTNLRLLPTPQCYFDDRDFRHYDALQGTALDPWEAVLILHKSFDNAFYFVVTKYYVGWVKAQDLTITDAETFRQYSRPSNFLAVTANKITLALGSEELLFQMGSILPLVSADEPKINKNLSRGFLPCTRNNFIRQAFKFLGDGYGWGGMEESVDCSAFTQNVYRSMGLEIPRDADKQELAMPRQINLTKLATAERYAQIKKAPPGALIFKPGHVMLYLGEDEEGTPMVIHAASSYFALQSGRLEKRYVRRVLVSDLRFLTGSGAETIDSLTSVGWV